MRSSNYRGRFTTVFFPNEDLVLPLQRHCALHKSFTPRLPLVFCCMCYCTDCSISRSRFAAWQQLLLLLLLLHLPSLQRERNHSTKEVLLKEFMFI